MAAPDYRNDLAAFFKAVYGDELDKMAYQSAILEALTRKPKDPKDEVFQWSGVDHGKAGGDHTAYVRYSYDGRTIHIDELSTEELYEDYDDCAPGQRPSIASLVARIGQRRCNCNAGYLIREDTRQLVVCTRCDGFSTQRGRRFRARA